MFHSQHPKKTVIMDFYATSFIPGKAVALFKNTTNPNVIADEKQMYPIIEKN